MMLTDDFEFDRFVYGLRELAHKLPALQGRASVSPLEIVYEALQCIWKFTEMIKRLGEENKKVSSVLDLLKDSLAEREELVTEQLRKQEELAQRSQEKTRQREEQWSELEQKFRKLVELVQQSSAQELQNVKELDQQRSDQELQ